MLGFLPSLGVAELLIILAIALVFFGAGKLPESAKAIGKAFFDLKGAVNSDIIDITPKSDGREEEKK